MAAFLAIIRIDVDPVLRLGPVAVHWYGVMYALAFAAGLRFGVLPHVLGRGVTRGQVERIAGWTIAAGLVGARLYYVAQSGWWYYLTHPQHILAVWEGGMAFFGAIMASIAALAVLARREQLPFWLLLDAGVLFAGVGQPIGRIGNLINGDILGAPSTLPWATAYTNPHAVLQAGFSLGVSYQPAAAYEAVGTLAILGVLLALRRRGARKGVLGLSYVSLYAISQLLIFQLRASEPVVALGLKQAQWTSIAVLALGMPLLYVVWRRTSAREQGVTASSASDHSGADAA